eukprot:1216803-Rhodomonas_salina.1
MSGADTRSAATRRIGLRGDPRSELLGAGGIRTSHLHQLPGLAPFPPKSSFRGSVADVSGGRAVPLQSEPPHHPVGDEPRRFLPGHRDCADSVGFAEGLPALRGRELCVLLLDRRQVCRLLAGQLCSAFLSFSRTAPFHPDNAGMAVGRAAVQSGIAAIYADSTAVYAWRRCGLWLRCLHLAAMLTLGAQDSRLPAEFDITEHVRDQLGEVRGAISLRAPFALVRGV